LLFDFYYNLPKNSISYFMIKYNNPKTLFVIS